ncbi:MAG: hypothetical protein ABUM26_03970 [Solirubrobacterales bacterium]
MSRLRTAGWLLLELIMWIVCFPIALVLLIMRLLGRGRGEDAEARVASLLQWYPASWRRRHGDELEALLHDAIADGRDDLALSLDVARAGMGERLSTVTAKRVSAGLMAGTGWTLFFPQGIVASVLVMVDGMPPTWFVALHLTGAAQWAAITFNILVGAALVFASMRMFARDCARRRRTA